MRPQDCSRWLLAAARTARLSRIIPTRPRYRATRFSVSGGFRNPVSHTVNHRVSHSLFDVSHSVSHTVSHRLEPVRPVTRVNLTITVGALRHGGIYCLRKHAKPTHRECQSPNMGPARPGLPGGAMGSTRCAQWHGDRGRCLLQPLPNSKAMPLIALAIVG